MAQKESLPGIQGTLRKEDHTAFYITDERKGFSWQIKIIMPWFYRQKPGRMTLPESQWHTTMNLFLSQCCFVESQNKFLHIL